MNLSVDFKSTIENAFLSYAASVAQERSIPDVRDGLKIGLRQGLYAQFTNKLTHKDKFQKAQKSVAAAMAQSYVHGDVAMYDTLIRAAKPWIYRYPIEEVQGAYGDPCAPDNHSAARYVEMKAGEIANYFFYGLKKKAIDEWYPNYDDTEMIPSVLPSIGFWNLVNGCTGIAVAMTTSVPQFNLREVNNALIKLIKNPKESFDNIYCAPDFAQGATILNGIEVKESLKNGKGASIKLQAKLRYDPDQNMIQATEMPFGVFTNTIIGQLQELTDNDENYGIARVVDHTKKTADIRIYLNKGVNPSRMIAKLYKDTSLENFFAINMTMLDNGRFPKLFGWQEACLAYIAHIRDCKRREIEYDLQQALMRKNIVDGLLIASANIDEIVALIRSSESPIEASQKLISRFNFNEEQIKAILAMKLSTLTKIDGIKLENEKQELMDKIAEYNHLLTNSVALDEKLIEALEEVANKFGDERRTKIIYSYQEESEPEEIEEKNIIVHLLNNNNIFLQEEIEDSGKRGSKGKKIGLPKNAEVIKSITTTSTSSLTFFTEDAKFYSYNLAEAEFNTTIYLPNNSRAILMIDNFALKSYDSLVTVTKNGYIKKTKVTDYLTRNSKGIAAAKVAEDDKLIFASFAKTDENIIICASNGYYNYYSINDVTYTGRYTQGARGIKLTDGAYVVSAEIEHKIDYIGLMSISSLGKGKITALSDYPKTSKAVKGNLIMTLPTDETIKTIKLIPENCEKVTAISGAKANTMWIKDIPVSGRATAGVKIIETKGDITIL